MREPQLGAHKILWLVVVTVMVFIVGLSSRRQIETSDLSGSSFKDKATRSQFMEHEVPLYPGSTKEVRIGDMMRVDGLPMTINSFETTDSPEAVMDFYERYYHKEGFEPSINRDKEFYQVCGVVDKAKNTFTTITALRTGSGKKTLVLPSYHDLMQAKKPNEYTDIPKYSDNLDRYVIDFDDLGVTNQNDVSLNKMSLSQTKSWYEHNMEQKGWKKIHVEEHKEEELVFMFFKKGNRNVTISISHLEGQSAVLMNIQNQ